MAAQQMGDGPRAGADMADRLSKIISSSPATSHAVRALAGAGELYVVGGAIRDLALGRLPKDIDLLARRVSAAEIVRLLDEGEGTVVTTGKAFGVIRYRHPSGDEVEIALPRREVSTGAGHRDFDVDYDPEIPLEVDLGRRDFTVNAISYELATGRVVDPHGGLEDIARGSLRLVSDTAFAEDPLRVLRAVRAHARFGLVPDDATYSAMRAHAAGIAHLSSERVGEELAGVLAADGAHEGIALAHRTGALSVAIPELASSTDDTRAELGMTRLRALMDADMATSVTTRAAALMSAVDDDPTRAAELAEARLRALARPNAEADDVSRLVRALGHEPATDAPAARRLVGALGAERAERFAVLSAAAGRPTAEPAMIHAVIASGDPVTVRDLAISGRDLIAHGIPAGPELGRTLSRLLDVVIEDPTVNRRETLLARV